MVNGHVQLSVATILGQRVAYAGPTKVLVKFWIHGFRDMRVY